MFYATVQLVGVILAWKSLCVHLFGLFKKFPAWSIHNRRYQLPSSSFHQLLFAMGCVMPLCSTALVMVAAKIVIIS